MADVRESFPTLEGSSQEGVSLRAVQEGDAVTAKNGSLAFAFKDSLGNTVAPQLNASGQVSVTDSNIDVLLSSRLKPADTLSAVTEITNVVHVDDDGGSLTVDGTVDINNISGTVSLPTGAATSALQTTGNASLSSIETKTPSLGQAAMASSQPVVIASDQTAVPISAASLPLPAGAATSALQTQPGVDIGDVTINNASGASAVNIQDGGNSITVDAANLDVALSTILKPADTLTAVTTLGTITNVVHVDDNAGSLTVDGSVTANAGTNLNTSALNLESTQSTMSAKLPATLGQKAMAASMAVVLASDQSSVPVAATLSAETVKVIGTVNVAASQTIAVTQPTGSNLHTVVDSGTLTTVSTVTSLTQMNGANISMGTGVRDSGTQRVTLATDDGFALQTGANTTLDKTASGSLVNVGDTASITTNGIATVGIQITGTWVGTLLFEATCDGSTYFSKASFPHSGTGATAVSTTGNTQLLVNTAGVLSFRVRRSVATSGTAVVSLQGSSAPAVVIATTGNVNNLLVAAGQTGTWNITNVSGTVSLPTGAATSALQTQPGVDIGDVTINNASGASAVNIQDGGNSITVDGTVTTNQTPSSASTFSPDNITSTALEASHVVKASAGNLYGLTGYNDKTTAQFIQLHNTTFLPADTAVPVVIFLVAGKSNFTLPLTAYGRYFSTGIVICNSSTAATKTIGSADCWFDVQYK